MQFPVISKTSSIPRMAAGRDVRTARPLGFLNLSAEKPMEHT